MSAIWTTRLADEWSAYTPTFSVIADMLVSQPSAKSCREQMQQLSPLFDHLIGAGEQRGRQRDAERLRGN